MKILEQFGKNYLDNLLPGIVKYCFGRSCGACLYGDEIQGNICPIRFIVAEKLGLKAEAIRAPSFWGFTFEEISKELPPPSIKAFKAAKIKDLEWVKSLVTWRW